MKINLNQDLESFVINHRLLIIEEERAKDAENACLYPKEVISRRWPMGEVAIAKDSYYTKLYEGDFGIKL